MHLGVTLHVFSFGGPASSGTCYYTAVPATVPRVFWRLPVYGLRFQLQENGTHDIWFPGLQTRTTWDGTVDCTNGVDSATQQVV